MGSGRLIVRGPVAAIRSCVLLLLAAVFGSGLIASSALAAGHGAPVTITRDSSGIPHIVATNFTALGYGEGYVFAQDDLCTFANDIVTLEGNRSRYFGPGGTAVNYSAGTFSTNLQSDLYWRYVKASGIIKRQLSAPPPTGLLPQVREIYTGWVAGYNRYLASGKLRDPVCKGKPWVHPINLTDMLLRGEQIVTEASAQQFVPGMVQAAPPTAQPQSADAAASRASHIGSLAAVKAQFDQAGHPQGSNGVGLGSQDTRSGRGMVLANPHFPWLGTERFWIAQLDVPGSYDVEGGTLMGFPLVGIGFNRHIAWTHTVSTSDRFVLYQLKLVPGDPTSYYFNGSTVKMGRLTVSLRAAGKTFRHTFFTTRWGTVVDVPAVPGNAYVWNRSRAYALYDATAPIGPRAADQFLRMGQARSVNDLFAVEAKWLAIPTFNTIAADDHGNAYYGDVGASRRDPSRQPERDQRLPALGNRHVGVPVGPGGDAGRLPWCLRAGDLPRHPPEGDLLGPLYAAPVPPRLRGELQ